MGMGCSLSNQSADDAISGIETFTYCELATATNNFSYPLGERGQGRLGPLYKGELQKTGQLIAVKRLDLSCPDAEGDFLREVIMLSDLQHPNIVELIGYCAEEHKRLVVFEFMVLGSLDYRLNGTRVDQNRVLEWSTRMTIAADVARGLNFLHSQKAVYGGLKSTNVLLGEGFHAKLSDLWLAKYDDQASSALILPHFLPRQLRMLQAKGYDAPEYLDTGILTMKSDVYSYGALLLEMISGTRTSLTLQGNGTHVALECARSLLQNNPENFPESGLRTAVEVVVMCHQKDPQARPDMNLVEEIMNYLASNPDASEDRDSRSPVNQEGELNKGKNVFEDGEYRKDDKSVFEKGESSKGDLDEIVEEREHHD